MNNIYFTKKEIIRFINYLLSKKDSLSKALYCDDVRKIIIDNTDPKKIYELVADKISVKAYNYKKIEYKEDLFELMITKHKCSEAREISEKISNGEFCNVSNKVDGTVYFKKWAEKVEYIPTRGIFAIEFPKEYSLFLKENPFSMLRIESLYKLVKNQILFYGFASITEIQIQYFIGFAKTIKIIDRLVEDGVLVKKNQKTILMNDKI